jgi:hypothetical protein
MRSSPGTRSRSAIVVLVGLTPGLQSRRAFENARKSTASWRSRNCRAASLAAVGTAFSLPGIAQPCPAAHVSGAEHRQASAGAAQGEADVPPAAVTRTTEGVEPRFDRGVTLVGHGQRRLVADNLRHFALAYILCVGALASVSSIPLQAVDMLKIDHGLHMTRVYAHARSIQWAP